MSQEANPSLPRSQLTHRPSWLVCELRLVLENEPHKINKIMRARIPIFLVILSVSVIIVLEPACAHKPPPPPKQFLNRTPARPINSIRVGNFQCEKAVTGQAVRNVFMETLAKRADVKVIVEGDADVVIEGTVTLGSGGSSSGSIGGGSSWIVGKSQGVGGDYISGITALVLRDGAILTSASCGQVIAKGREILPPEYLARDAATRLSNQLEREGLKRR